MNPADSKMRCNGGRGADLVAPVAAGTNITAFWKQWTHAQGYLPTNHAVRALYYRKPLLLTL